MTDFPSGHGLGIYRQARIRTTMAAAVVLLVPFCVLYALLDVWVLNTRPELHHPTLEFLVGSVIFGLVLSVGFGRFVSNHILNLAEKLDSALFAVEQRERERDLAQQELIKKLQYERELVRQRIQFESQLASYEKYAALAQLALGAAHEINNPLLGIQSHLELELRHTNNTEDRAEIEQCIEATKRISTTIRSLLNYARPGPPQLTKVNLERLVDETVGFVSHQPLFRKVRLEKLVAPGLPPITADANQISQVLMNLLLNAAQAINDGGAITVYAQRALNEKEAIELRVTDTGKGIPADILPHVFEPFFTTKRGKGTGLGLSISQSYVRNHGGEIQVDSIEGRGTAVRITLPIEQVRENATPQVQEIIA